MSAERAEWVTKLLGGYPHPHTQPCATCAVLEALADAQRRIEELEQELERERAKHR